MDKMNVAVKPANLNMRKSDRNECDKAGEEGDSKGGDMDECDIEGMSNEDGIDECSTSEDILKGREDEMELRVAVADMPTIRR